ncbi:MAG: serine/threonine protein kinase [Deltaproteobacteria bacterium]|nr:serine/threonine protein kinase [Deltaproteobacteria bacterium]
MVSRVVTTVMSSPRWIKDGRRPFAVEASVVRTPNDDSPQLGGDHDTGKDSPTRTLETDEAAVGSHWERSVGGRLGRYVIKGRLGAGAMGVVYDAVDPQLGRAVAIKLLHPSSSGRTRAAERFAREVRAMARLEHPHVVSLFDFGVRDGEAFLVMERVQGQTLSRWLATQPSRTERLRLMQHAGEGLAAAHRAGLVHRDFKPDNVLVTLEGTAKVTDFGLARAYAAADRSPSSQEPTVVDGLADGVTGHGAVVGTPSYMSVEQHRAEELTPRSDQYSYCVSLCEALLGERPFAARSLDALLQQKQAGPPARLLQQLPRPMARVIERGLSPTPAERFDDMEALLLALRGRHHHRWWWWLGAAVILLAVVVATVGRERSTCGLDPEERRALWGEAQRSALHESFGRSSAAHAPGSEQRVSALMAEHARAWTASYEAACGLEETRRDPAMACLARHRAGLERRRDSLHALATSELASAVATAESQPDPRGCLAPGAAMQLEPKVVAVLDEVHRLREAASEARRRGDLPRARALLLQAVTAVDTIEAPSLRAGPLRELGDSLDDIGATDAARQTLLTALYQASAANDSRLAATTATRLAWVEGISMRNTERGHQWTRQAEALMDRFEPSVSMRVGLLMNRATLHQIDDDQRSAQVSLTEARRLLVSAPAAAESGERTRRAGQRARLEHNIGVIRHSDGDDAEALEAFGNSVAAIEVSRGLEHPDLVEGLEGMLYAAHQLGEVDTAREVGLRWLAIVEGNRGATHPSVAPALKALAFVEYGANDKVRSRQYLERAIATLEPDAPLRLGLEVDLAGLVREFGQLDEAHAIAKRVYDRLEHTSGASPDGPRSAALRELSLIASRQGQHSHAIRQIERAIIVAEGTAFGQDNALLLATTQLEVLQGAGRHAAVVKMAATHMALARDAPATAEAQTFMLTLCDALLDDGGVQRRVQATLLVDELQGWADAGMLRSPLISKRLARLRRRLEASG